MSPLTPAAIADLQAFAATHGANYLTTPDPVHPQRWTKPDRANLQLWIQQCGLQVPNGISRADIFGTIGALPIELIFLLTMMWGYQTNGAGAWRTERAILTPNFINRLTQWFNLARANNLAGAYRAMTDPALRIERIGLAFASKLWYFAAYDENQPWPVQPLILDSRVHKALRASQFRHLNGPLLLPAWHQFARQQPADVSLTNYAYYQWYLQLAVAIRNNFVPQHRIDIVEFWLFSRANDVA